MPEIVLHPTGIKNNHLVYDMPQVPFRFHDLASSVPKMIVDVGKSYVTLPTGIPKDVIKEVQYYSPIPPKPGGKVTDIHILHNDIPIPKVQAFTISADVKYPQSPYTFANSPLPIVSAISSSERKKRKRRKYNQKRKRL